MKKNLYFILIFILYGLSGYAGNVAGTCELSGHIVDFSTGDHLPYATIRIKGTTIGTSTDASGHFFLTQLPSGKHMLIASLIGYHSSEQEIILKEGTKSDITLQMKEDAVQLSTVVVSANRNETKRKEAPAIVNVLTPLVFESTNSNMLSEGLCFLPGLRVENDCQNCGFQQVRINGLDGQYSQLLIDGRPIISALNGVYGIEQIPAGMIERVEVMRGGGSALYGSNAIGGVINIITREALTNTGSVAHNLTMIGGKSAENNTSLSASIVGSNNRSGLYLFSNIKNRNPYDNDNDGFTEICELKGNTSGFRAFYKPDSYSKITLEYHNITEKRRGGNLLNLPPHEADVAEAAEHNINGGGLKYDIYSRNYKHKVSIYGSAQYTERDSYYGAGKDPNAYGSTTDMTADAGTCYTYDFNHLWFMPASLAGGFEYNTDHLIDEAPGYHRSTDQTARIGSFFLQNEWKNEKMSILLGGRLDKHNMVEDVVFSPRLNFRYNPIEDIGLRLSYSEGFRAPQVFSEDLHILAVKGTVVLIESAPDLKPEHTKSYSASADLYHTFGSVQTNLLAEVFYTDLKDVFVLEKTGTNADGNEIQEKRNGSGAIVKGMNIELKVAPSRDYQLQAGLTLQQSEYKKPEKWSDDPDAPFVTEMFRSPDLYGYFTGTAKPLKKFSVSLSGTYTGSMYVEHFAGDIPKDKIEKSPDFFDANFKLSYTFKLNGSTGIEIYAGIYNLFNAYQKDFDKGKERDAGYIYGPVYPRSYFGGLKIVFL